MTDVLELAKQVLEETKLKRPPGRQDAYSGGLTRMLAAYVIKLHDDVAKCDALKAKLELVTKARDEACQRIIDDYQCDETEPSCIGCQRTAMAKRWMETGK